MPTDLPDAPSTARNRDAILAVLRAQFAACRRVLEIGSGTGQHAVHFAAALPHLIWQCADLAEALPGMRMWLAEAALPNTPEPLVLDAAMPQWPALGCDAVFSANTLHIMRWTEVAQLFAHLAALPALRTLIVYGPFKYHGRHTSESNAAFDVWLAAQAPHRAVRDFEAVDALAQAAGLHLVEDRAMPANNRCIVWQRG